MAVASRQNAVDITITTRERRSVCSGIIAVDAADYPRTHTLVPTHGDLNALTGDTVFTGPAQHSEQIRTGEVLMAEVEGKPLSLTVVGGLPETLEPGESFVVPRGILPRQVQENAPTESVVEVGTEQNAGVVAERIERAGIGEVSTVADWAETRAGRNQAGNVRILAVLMVFGMSGLSRPQVVRTAVAEATAVAVIGLVLGCVVAGAALAGIGGLVRSTIGVTAVHVPRTLVAVVTPEPSP